MSKALNIIELKAECEAGHVSLTVRKSKKDDTLRFFWNQTNTFGGIPLLIGDLTKPETSQPFIIKPPSKHAKAELNSTGLNTFVGVPDPEEAEAWTWFCSWYLDQIIAAEVVQRKKPVKGKPDETDAEYRTRVEMMCVLPAKLPETDTQHVCISPKIQTGGTHDELVTQCLYLKDGVEEDGSPCFDSDGTFKPENVSVSARVAFYVELGELKYVQGAWRTMLYARSMMMRRSAQKEEPKVVMGGMQIRAAAPKAAPAAVSGGTSAAAAPVVDAGTAATTDATAAGVAAFDGGVWGTEALGVASDELLEAAGRDLEAFGDSVATFGHDASDDGERATKQRRTEE